MQGLCEFGLGQHETALRTLLRARSLGIARDAGDRARRRVSRRHPADAVRRVRGRLRRPHRAVRRQRREPEDDRGARPEPAADADPAGGSARGEAAAGAARRPGRRSRWAADASADAARLLDELVAAYPREPNVHYARGVLRTTEAPDLALDDFVAELAVSPRHVPARLQLVFELREARRRGQGEAVRRGGRPPRSAALRRPSRDGAGVVRRRATCRRPSRRSSEARSWRRAARRHTSCSPAPTPAPAAPPTPSANAPSSAASSSSRPASRSSGPAGAAGRRSSCGRARVDVDSDSDLLRRPSGWPPRSRPSCSAGRSTPQERRQPREFSSLPAVRRHPSPDSRVVSAGRHRGGGARPAAPPATSCRRPTSCRAPRGATRWSA